MFFGSSRYIAIPAHGEYRFDKSPGSEHSFGISPKTGEFTLPRKYSFPAGHWNWPVRLSHQHAVRAGNLVFTGGQSNLDQRGFVQNIGELDAQCRASITHVVTLLKDLDADASDLLRLVIYYVGDASDEKLILSIIADVIGQDVKPVVSLTNVPILSYPGMLVEIEGVAIHSPEAKQIPRQCHHLADMPSLPPAFSHVVRAEDIIFTSDISALGSQGTTLAPGDIVAQTTIMMERLRTVLCAVDADISDVVKVNTFYRGDGTAEDWARSAEIRAAYFPDPGPTPTGIPLPSFPQPGLTTKIAATAICAIKADGTVQPKRFAWSDGHWNWTVPLPYKHGNECGNIIHIGGQVSLDSSANVLHPGDMVMQTQVAIQNLAHVLAELDASLDDVVKLTTFYQSGPSETALDDNLLIRSDAFSAPGPATTSIPVPALVYENMIIEIEAIAILD